ncbi:PorV/PorQ family protein [candidate division KSB1 bacterium]|nr:PorV/PorQ family protein [candidate division KSB1 bacterium]
MKNRRIFNLHTIFIGCALYTISLHAVSFGQEVKKVGTSAAAFLRIPVGTKAIAMGSAFTAIADDGSAMFWNPGNIAPQTERTLFIHHSPWLPGLDFQYIGVLLPVQRIGVVGVNVVSLTSEDMDVTTPDAPMGTGETFNAASYAAGLAFASSLTDRFSIGANFKFIQERIYHSIAQGFAFDVGTMFVTPFKNVRFGVAISNIGTRMAMDGDDLNSYVDVAPTHEGNNPNIVAKMDTDSFDPPIMMRMGVSWDWWLSDASRVTFACDGVNPNDNAQYINLGIEWASFHEAVVLQGGFNELLLEEREKGMTLGGAIRLPSVSGVSLNVGYAFQEFRYLGSVNHFSVQLAF